MSVVNSPVRLYTFIFLDDALSVGNDAMYSEPSLPFRTMPKSSYVIEKNALTAWLMSSSRDTEGYATTIAAQADSPAAYFSFTPFVVFSPE